MVNKAQISSNAPAPKNRMLSQCSAKKKKKDMSVCKWTKKKF